jgi:hypothetical protein
MKINGFDYYGTVNLRAALDQLFIYGHRRVWIDAVCINQEDEEERSSQVKHMHRIYANAHVVVAFIGNIRREEAEKLKRLVDKELHSNGHYQETPGSELQFATQDDVTLDISPSVEWQTLRKFFRQPYWKRMWIIQEVRHHMSFGSYHLCDSIEMLMSCLYRLLLRKALTSTTEMCIFHWTILHSHSRPGRNKRMPLCNRFLSPKRSWTFGNRTNEEKTLLFLMLFD